uniref:Non-histone chromosomal protein n=1 Tax=Marseillevirus LCMAC102 TaxID=2506603 RepID=A0A481YTY8_9VIRU|nr:MAG: non-histone chromosomal protein [Marseillevirus LCMAC102]
MAPKRHVNKRQIVPKVIDDEKVQTETDEEKDVYNPEKPMSEEEEELVSSSNESPPEKPKPVPTRTRKTVTKPKQTSKVATNSEEELVSSSNESPDESPPEKPKPVPTRTRKTVTKPKQTSKVATNSEETQESDKRYFKILIDRIAPENNSPPVSSDVLSSGGGRYTGRNPMQAAKKAFTRICRAASSDGADLFSYTFAMQETTQSSAKKVFAYRGIREALDKPQKVTKGTTNYDVCFTSQVRSYKPAAKPTTKKNTSVERQTGADRGKSVTPARGGRGRKK